MNPANWDWQTWIGLAVTWAALILVVGFGWSEFCIQRRRNEHQQRKQQPGQTRDALWPQHGEETEDD